MTLKTLFLTFALLSMSCQLRHGPLSQAPSGYVFKINFNVQPLEDSSDYHNLLASLDGFLRTKNQSGTSNPYWLASDFKRHYQPFAPILFIETNERLGDTNYFKPTLLDIVHTSSKNEFIVKLAFIGIDSTGRGDLRCIYNLIAIRKESGFKFASVFERSVSSWHRTLVGKITYVYRGNLDIALANKMNQFNEDFPRRFNIEPTPFTYYKCENPVELYRLYGLDYTPSMYLDSTGGRWVPADTAFYAANNSEWYPRELVAYYLIKAFGGNANFTIREGYATLLAGTTGKSLDDVLRIAGEFYRAHPERDVLADLTNGYRIHGNLYLDYPVGGLICRMVDQRFGTEGIRNMFRIGTGDDGLCRAVDSLLGIDRSHLSSFLRKEIVKFAVRIQ